MNGKNTSETKSSEEVGEHCCTLESKTLLRSPFDHSVFTVEQSFRFWRCCNSCTSTKLNVIGVDWLGRVNTASDLLVAPLQRFGWYLLHTLRTVTQAPCLFLPRVFPDWVTPVTTVIWPAALP